MSLKSPSPNIIDFRSQFPHLDDAERRHFHACKLINETITADRTLTKRAIDERFQFYIRMLEAFDSASQQVTPGSTYRVLRRTAAVSAAASTRWQAIGPAHKTLDSANIFASKAIPDDGAGMKYAQIEEGLRYFEFGPKEKGGAVVEVIVVRCGAPRRDSCGIDDKPEEPE